MIKIWQVAAAGWALAATFLFLFIDARGDVKAEIERCNTEKVESVRKATELLRDAQMGAYEDRIAELEQIAEDEARARLIAQEAATEAMNRPERVRTVIKEASGENSCIDTVIPDDIIDELR